MSRLEKKLKGLTIDEIERLFRQVRIYSFSDILVSQVYQNFSCHEIDTHYREISIASMKVLILRLFDISGHLSDFNFQEMYSFFMMSDIKDEQVVEEELCYMFEPNREPNLLNRSTEELIEIVIDFARYMGLELFYTCLKELCLCTNKPIVHATYTYFILNEDNYINFIKCLYKENHGDREGALSKHLNPDLLKYHYEHHL